jgi:hypothetical protein
LVRSLRSSHRLFSLHRWAQKNARKVHVKMMRRSMAPPPRSWGLGRRSGVSGQNSLGVWHTHPLGALVALPRVCVCVCVCVCVSPDVLTVMVGPRLCSQASTHAAAKGASTNKTTLRLRKWGRPTMGRRQRSNTRVSDQHAHCQARTSRCSLAVVNVLTVAVSPCWRIFTGRGRKRAKGPSAGEDGASSEDEETPKKKTRRVQREHHPSSHIHTHAVDTGACTLAP